MCGLELTCQASRFRVQGLGFVRAGLGAEYIVVGLKGNRLL